MLEKVDASVESKLGLDEFVAFCRSAEARMCWPGVAEVPYQGGGFFYTQTLRPPWARKGGMLKIEEHQRNCEDDGAGISFESMAVWVWPNQETATSWLKYHFEKGDGGSRLNFSLRYVLPVGLARRLTKGPELTSSMERTVDRYLECLARGGKGQGIAEAPTSVEHV